MCAATYPLDLTKTRLQIQGEATRAAVSTNGTTCAGGIGGSSVTVATVAAAKVWHMAQDQCCTKNETENDIVGKLTRLQ